MSQATDLTERVAVTFTVAEWAQVIASVAHSPLALDAKEYLNATIFETVTRQERALS